MCPPDEKEEGRRSKHKERGEKRSISENVVLMSTAVLSVYSVVLTLRISLCYSFFYQKILFHILKVSQNIGVTQILSKIWSEADFGLYANSTAKQSKSWVAS